MFENRTIYTIVNEHREKTTITIEKLIADVLQALFSDVHRWLQNAYDRVSTKYPNLGRRQKGDIVRLLSIKAVEKSPQYKKLLKEQLGL